MSNRICLGPIIAPDNMATAWPALEFILSVKAIVHIKEITLPYIGIILGPPSGIKTLILELLRGRNRTFYSDNFNPKAMVSHAILPPWMNEGDQHMLLKMKNNIVLAPELAILFAKPEDELRELIAILTRVADGGGIESDTGLGHKGVTGMLLFVVDVSLDNKVYVVWRGEKLIKPYEADIWLERSANEGTSFSCLTKVEKSLTDTIRDVDLISTDVRLFVLWRNYVNVGEDDMNREVFFTATPP